MVSLHTCLKKVVSSVCFRACINYLYDFFTEIPKHIRGGTVVITGGARGIGAEVVKQCLQLEMNVIIGKLVNKNIQHSHSIGLWIGAM